MRTKRMVREHQGQLTDAEMSLFLRMEENPKVHFTSLMICRATGCVSARDKIRKLQANGVKIGPAKLLRVNENGSRIYGWRISA